MYDPWQTLASIDDHKWPILALCGLAMVCNYVWFFEAYRVSRRERTYTFPVFATLFWLAGDASMVWRFDTWFNTYDHWYLKLFWLALVFTVLFELAFLGQTIRYGRDELLPSWSKRQFNVLMLGGVALALLVFSFFKHVLGDPIYINYFHIANVVGPLFTIGLLVRRRSAAGHTPLLWGGYTVMLACWYTACALWFGEPFGSAEYIVFYVTNTLLAFGLFLAVRRMRAAVSPNDHRLRIDLGGVEAVRHEHPQPQALAAP